MKPTNLTGTRMLRAVIDQPTGGDGRIQADYGLLGLGLGQAVLSDWRTSQGNGGGWLLGYQAKGALDVFLGVWQDE